MKSKVCIDCKIEKTLDNYTINKATKDGHCYRCRVCKNLKDRNTYRSKDNIQKYNRDAHKKRKQRYYSIILDYLGTDTYVCTKCGYTHKYHAPFDWHHIDDTTKEYEVSSMVRHTRENIIKELDKCILLCSNCHRLLHYQESTGEKQ